MVKNKLPYPIEDLNKWSKFLGNKDFDDYVKTFVDKDKERETMSWWPLSEVACCCKNAYNYERRLIEYFWHRD
jgi:hypothetical protein